VRRWDPPSRPTHVKGYIVNCYSLFDKQFSFFHYFNNFFLLKQKNKKILNHFITIHINILLLQSFVKHSPLLSAITIPSLPRNNQVASGTLAMIVLSYFLGPTISISLALAVTVSPLPLYPRTTRLEPSSKMYEPVWQSFYPVLYLPIFTSIYNEPTFM